MPKRRLDPKTAAPDSAADMTPMIDVVFLLIIFFLCIDFRVLEAKLPAYLPKDAGSHRHVMHVEKLHIRILCAPGDEGTREPRPGQESRPSNERSYRLVGHRVHYYVGPRKVAGLQALKRELFAVRNNPSFQQPDPRRPGVTKLIGALVEPGKNVVYGDVAECVDTLAALQFQDIGFAGDLPR